MDEKLIFFFLVFASLVVGIYYIVPKKFRYIVLLVFSFLFYGLYSTYLTAFIIFTIVTIYLTGLFINSQNAKFEKQKEGLEKEERKKLKKKFKRNKNWVVAIAIILNLACIAVLKYSGLFASMFEGIFSWFNVVKVFPVLKIGLPLGISYYTLSSIGYMVDVNRGKYAGEKNFFKVALFVLYFPQLLEGPFASFDKLAPSLYEGNEFDRKKFEHGILKVIWGFFKKIVIADRLAIIAGEIFSSYSQYSGVLVIVGVLAFTFQLYAEFSGIIDIASGISNMLGFDLAKNFEQPFYSKNINEFWRRWHISLGTWLREYIFYPISMSKGFSKMNKRLHGKVKPFFEAFIPSAIALFFVWFVNGLWHGASLKYIVYGLYYYLIMMIGMIFEPANKKLFTKMKVESGSKKEKALNIFRIARTFVLVNIGMLIFRAATLESGWLMFAQIFSNGRWLIPTSVIDVYDIVWCILGVILLLAVDILKEHKVDILGWFNKNHYIVKVAICLALILVILIFGAYGDGYIPVDPIYGGF